MVLLRNINFPKYTPFPYMQERQVEGKMTVILISWSLTFLNSPHVHIIGELKKRRLLEPDHKNHFIFKRTRDPNVRWSENMHSRSHPCEYTRYLWSSKIFRKFHGRVAMSLKCFESNAGIASVKLLLRQISYSTLRRTDKYYFSS